VIVAIFIPPSLTQNVAMPKLLLVEDYESIRDVYFIALIEEGFQVDTASSGAEALDKTAHSEYDLICLDMVMLGYSGIEFLEAFRVRNPDSKTKVIILSNIDSPKIVERAKALAADQYLIKSHYTPKQLTAVICKELDLTPKA